MDLQTITKMMLSQDYKERMKGEYYHLLNLFLKDQKVK